MNRFIQCLLILFLLLSFRLTAQKIEVLSHNFFAQTNDVVLWDGVEYMISKSPLSYYKCYNTIFGDLSPTTKPVNVEDPVEFDKNYKAKWMIKNKRLFLYDVEILDEDEARNYPDKKKILEQLTNQSFRKNTIEYPQFPDGIMHAIWFTGFIYLKRQPASGESYCDCTYINEYFKVLGFRNGALIHEDKCFSMELFIDSSEIQKIQEKNKKNYMNPQIPLVNPSRCKNYLKEKESLKDNQALWENFIGQTNDEIAWNGKTFMLSESPLNSFDNYKNIYPNVWRVEIDEFLPRHQEKNYSAKWVIINNSLYLQDVDFQMGEKKLVENKTVIVFASDPQANELHEKEYAVRFQAIEKLTGHTFKKLPASNHNVIFAEWFSGTLYFKRLPTREEELKLDEKSIYSCEPHYKIVIAKGKVKSTEKTNLMIAIPWQ